MKFNIDEIFYIAEQIERNGALFYSKAAVTFEDQKLKRLLEELAAMELQHEQVFKKLHADIKFHQASVIFDVDENAVAYVQALASDYVFPANHNPTDFIKKDTHPAELLQFAIGLEKDSIVFYYGLKSALVNQADVHQIEAIIKQEFGHINQLSQMASSIHQR
jgi:rubrerythrin